MLLRRHAALFLVMMSTLAACAARRPARSAPEPASTRQPVAQPTKPARAPLPADVVARAAMPWHGFRVADGSRLAPEELLDAIADADALCLGEQHDNPHHHYAQLALLEGLIQIGRMGGRELAVGFEAFQVPAQPFLDDWAARGLDDAELLEATEWSERWGFDFSLYRPLLAAGRRARLPLLALNAPRELTQAIARGGIDSLNQEQRKSLPELDLDDADHRAWFEGMMKRHPAPHSSLNDAYTVQVTWDETMAERAARWLGKRRPARQVVIIAGLGHCRADAVPARVTRRTGARALAIKPLVMAAEADPCGELDGFDYGIIMTPPER